MPKVTHKFILKAFQFRGLYVRPTAVSSVQIYLERAGNTAQNQQLLDALLDAIGGMNLTDSFVSEHVVARAIKICENQSQCESDAFLCVIPAYEFPKYRCDAERKRLFRCSTLNLPEPQAFGSAGDRTTLFRDRYMLILQRLSQVGIFNGPYFGESSLSRFELMEIERLCVSGMSEQKVILFGMLNRSKKGHTYLEDLTGSVELDLEGATYVNELLFDNCMVVVEGVYRSPTVVATAIGMPPLERRALTQQLYGSENFFGGPNRNDNVVRVNQEEYNDSMFVFVSDVHLDDGRVECALNRMFAGFANQEHMYFVFFGRFLKQFDISTFSDKMKGAFSRLAGIIAQFPTLSHKANFIIVPSLYDSIFSSVLPSPELPQFILEPLLRQVAHCTAATNPCRIRFGTQQMILFRDDIVERMCRRSFHEPANPDRIPVEFAKTILAQSHLTPFSLYVEPVFWAYDHVLQFYTTPDVIVVADKYRPFAEVVQDCTVVNPSSFSRGDEFVFQVYIPATKAVECSAISDNPFAAESA